MGRSDHGQEEEGSKRGTELKNRKTRSKVGEKGDEMIEEIQIQQLFLGLIWENYMW